MRAVSSGPSFPKAPSAAIAASSQSCFGEAALFLLGGRFAGFVVVDRDAPVVQAVDPVGLADQSDRRACGRPATGHRPFDLAQPRRGETPALDLGLQ
jgi:hypothetical protein